MVIAWMCIATVALILLTRDLPTNGFFSGDPGLKLIAAFEAIAHPARPFEVDLPRVGGQPRPWVDPMFEIHGNHAHALQSPLFPVLSAPLIVVAGLRGAYLLPAISFVLLVPLMNATRRALVPSLSPAWLGFFVVVVNPVFFYALEFWEHVPAIALLTAVTALVSMPNSHARPAASRMVAAGLLGGIAVLLRPEAAWYLAALVAVLGLRFALFAQFGAGAGLILLPFAIANFMHSGNPLGAHATANLAPLGSAYIETHVHRTALWLLPSSGAGLIGAALLVVSSGARILSFRSRHLYWSGLAGGLLIAASAAFGELPRESLWTAWPVGVLALTGLRRDRSTAMLGTISLITLSGITLTSTHDGGAQWGPRFLLIAAPALVLLAAKAAQELTTAVPYRTLTAVLVVLVCMCGAASTRRAYRELRASKRYYARVVAAAQRVIPPGGYAITDVWWFDQIAAPLWRSRTILYVKDEPTTRTATEALALAGIVSVVLVSSGEEPGEFGVTGSCFHEVHVEAIEERRLRFATLQCGTTEH
ncbi:MAG: hypothetical protein ACM36C_11810 [Acidobacteriota bacterium]